MAFKNAKFDSFLKKRLAPKEYEQVKITEACVVHSNVEKYNHRFVFVTDKKLSITENPPKSILWSVEFSEIVDINMLHDTADFLQKSLQDTVQHIALRMKFKQYTGCIATNSSSTSAILRHTNQDVIHLYILNQESKIYPLVCALWTSFLLDATDQLAAKDSTQIIDEAIASSLDKISSVFTHINHSAVILLTTGDASLENIYELFHEMRLMMKTSMFAKSLFWRSSEMLVLCSNYVSTYTNSNTSDPGVRADEIEVATLVLETIRMALVKTETLSKCQRVLAQCSEEFYLKIFGNLLVKPKLNSRLLPMSNDMKILTAEYTRTCGYLLYDFLNVFEQGTTTNRQATLTRSTFTEMILNQGDHKQFMRILLHQFFIMWQSDVEGGGGGGGGGKLLPPQVSNVFRIIYLVNHFMAASESLQAHLSDSFLEDYTYLVKPFLNQRIENSLPASVITHKMFDNFNMLLISKIPRSRHHHNHHHHP